MPQLGHSALPGLEPRGHPQVLTSMAWMAGTPAPRSHQSGPSPSSPGAPAEEVVKRLASAGPRGPGFEAELHLNGSDVSDAAGP